MAAGGIGGGGVGLTDVLTVLKNGVVALGNIAKALNSTFPQSGQASTSATSGTAGALPPQPAGYLTVMIDGAPRKVPYFNP